MKRRFKKLWQLLDADLEAMLITSPENVRYLSGFTGTEGTILLEKKKGFFLTDGRYTAQAEQQIKNFNLITFKEKWKEIGRLIKRLHIQSLGFEARHMTVALLQELKKESPSIRFMPQIKTLDQLRAIKEPVEIAAMKKAAQIASRSLESVIPFIKPGIRERDIAIELEYRMRKNGGEGLSFDIIVASGIRTALPHGVASDKKIKKDDLLVIDYGTIYHGYCSDKTTTFVVGKPTQRQKKFYNIVKQAHDRAISAVKPGQFLKKVDAAARGYIEKMGYKRYFHHSTGHGVGLSVHEPPLISPLAEGKLQEGMVFTIEPGIYIAGWGGVRIEDTMTLTSRGAEIITPIDKSLLCL